MLFDGWNCCYPGSVIRGQQTFRVRGGRSSAHNSTSALEWISIKLFKLHIRMSPGTPMGTIFFINNLQSKKISYRLILLKILVVFGRRFTYLLL